MIHFADHISDQAIVSLWKIEEDLGTLIDLYPEADLPNIHPIKRLEQLASRILIRQICQKAEIPFEGLQKDDHGKPHFINSKYELSISHSYPWVCCMIHSSASCGIDIESPRDQLRRIQGKFISKQEHQLGLESLDRLCLVWSAKEAIYKIYGRKYLSLKNDILITEIQKSTITAQVNQGGKLDKIELSYRSIEGYVLVYGNL